MSILEKVKSRPRGANGSVLELLFLEEHVAGFFFESLNLPATDERTICAVEREARSPAIQVDRGHLLLHVGRTGKTLRLRFPEIFVGEEGNPHQSIDLKVEVYVDFGWFSKPMGKLFILQQEAETVERIHRLLAECDRSLPFSLKHVLPPRGVRLTQLTTGYCHSSDLATKQLQPSRYRDASIFK